MYIRPYRPPAKGQAFKALTMLWLGGMLTIVILSVVPLPPEFANARVFGVFPLDKVLHTTFFTLLTAMPVLLFRSPLRIGVCVAALAVLSFTTEYLQIFNPTRNSSFEDVAANFVGCATGLACALLLRFLAPHRFPLETPDA